jgi:6-pyruvoyltetrahydropterin/6-carboxytetrahydropterin synthase
MVYITRKENFNAAHKLYKADWSEEKNLEVFGKCANPNWHGHNYQLFVTVKGDADPETGYVADLKKLSALIKSLVTDKLDHKNLNMDVDFMKGKMASTEVLAMAIWGQLEASIAEMGVELHSVRVVETENNSVEYFGSGK